MTTPTERATAVLRTYDFLEMLSRSQDNSVPEEISLQAETLLRHYPSEFEIELTSKAFPTCWQMPVRRDES